MANTSSHSVGVLVRPPPLAKAQVSRMDTGGPRFRLRTKTSGFGAPPTAEAAPSAIVQTPADEEEAQVSPAAHLLQLMQGEVARALSLMQLAPSAFRPVHLPTLQLRLDIITLAKRVAWEAAVRVPGLVQRRQHAVLCRVLARPLLDPACWEPSGRSAGRTPRPPPTSSTFTSVRRDHAIRIRKWVRMTLKKRTPQARKRTVFSTRRGQHLSGGGRGWGRGVR